MALEWRTVMMSCLLLPVLGAPRTELSFSSPANLDLVIGVDPVHYGTLYWNAMPQPDQELQVKVGTRLVFKYDTSHDVSLADSEAGWLDCDTDGFEELAEPTYGGGAAGEPENLFAAVVTAVGEYYFVCGQPGHCSAGQKVKVVVTMGSPPPPPASPPPEHPPAPPMSPRYIWPSPSPPPPANPPAAPCKDNPEYEDEGLWCEDWVGKDCYEDVVKQKSEGSLPATFDLNRLLASCPDGCLDGQPNCYPPPPNPSPPAPPAMPPPPPSPPAPPSAPPRPPHARCFDDPEFMAGGWPCADWAGRQCRKLAPFFGVDVELLVYSCPNACADVVPYCNPSDFNPPPAGPPPPPPSPPPDLGWCLGYSFSESVADSVASVLLSVLIMLLLSVGLRCAQPRLQTPRFPAKETRYSGVAVWLLMITIPSIWWMAAVGPYAACYSSPAILVFGLLLWILVSSTMLVGALSDPGVIPRSLDGRVPDDSVRRTQHICGVEFELKVCQTCGIVRPPRSSHDRKTDRCVLKFDHFCIFIGNTVGKKNYLWFLCFVGLTSTGAIYFVCTSLWQVFHLAGRLEREAGLDSGTAIAKAVGRAFPTVVIGVYFSVMGGLVSLLFMVHCYFVSTGQTTYEFMRGAWKKGKPNPFNKGLRANWTSVVRDATEGGRCGMRSPIDGGGEGEGWCIPIETKNATVPRMDEYTGAKIYSPSSSPVLDGHPAEAGDASSASGMTELHGLGDKAGPRVEAAPGLTPPPLTPGPPPTSAEFQVVLGDQIIATTLTAKMLKKPLQKALIEPLLKQFKQKIDTVIIDGERADVKQPASSFVKPEHADRTVFVQLIRPGDRM